MKNKLNKNYSKRKTYIDPHNKNPFEYKDNKDNKQNTTFHIYIRDKLDFDISKTIINFCNIKSRTIKNNRTQTSDDRYGNKSKYKRYKIPKKYDNIFRTKTQNVQFPKKINASKTYLNKKEYYYINKNNEKYTLCNISKSNIFKQPKKNMNSTLNNKKSHFLSKKKYNKGGNTIKSIRNKLLSENSKKSLSNYSKSFIQIKNTKNLMKFDINKIYKIKEQIKEKDNTLDNGRKYISLREQNIFTNSKLSLLKRIPKNYGSLLNKIVRDNIKNKNKNDEFDKRNKNLIKFNSYKNDYENSFINQNQNSITHSRINIKASENNNGNINIKLSKSKNGNNNISSRQTIFSSYITSEKNVLSMIKSNGCSEEKNNKENSPKNLNDYINLESESNDIETKEYESKFLNYELGVSDKKSTNNYNLDNNNYKNNETIKNELEKPVEEIEKIADQILNKSNYKNKNSKISFLQNIFVNKKSNKDN